ncbi:permease [Salisediminibacterium selenitireducens]|uniref:Permease n=1 Tax=Bacillus selenitireducens (strain ATCC 700615 / DSM 15326 / MLS10) TaxID=439292 RepID=D6XXN1_BACIE|nr:permease [Salisediminibacterium selenitireducens]ADI00074.1 permease [[Bacillus] selenitireducens MLS10]
MEILQAGWQFLLDYLTLPRIVTLTIVFFISGAIAQFMSQGVVLKYFGPDAKKSTSFTMASVSGVILTVCSCSVLPMFASIWKKGAGIGPAVTFLFAGPAINVLAITFTFSFLGMGLGISRVVTAMILAVLIGILMHLLFHREEKADEKNSRIFDMQEESERPLWQNMLFFLTLLVMLLAGMNLPYVTAGAFLILIVQLVLFFDRDELWDWCLETYDLVKKIVPLFIVGIFIAGVITVLIPETFMGQVAGENTLSATLLASVFGAFMYFATLTEVPIVQSFLDLGMAKGPALALLLAGPSMSLPNMLIVGKVMGVKKTLAYISMVTALSAVMALITGWLFF